MATGQPRVHTSWVQLDSKYWLGCLAVDPVVGKSLLKLSRTAALRLDAVICANVRAASAPMKPKMTPFDPSRGESSKVTLTGPFSDSAIPFSPASRQKGLP